MWYATLYEFRMGWLGNKTVPVETHYFGDEVECLAFISPHLDGRSGYSVAYGDIGPHPDHPVEIEYSRRIIERAEAEYRREFEIDHDDYDIGRFGQPISRARRSRQHEIDERLHEKVYAHDPTLPF